MKKTILFALVLLLSALLALPAAAYTVTVQDELLLLDETADTAPYTISVDSTYDTHGTALYLWCRTASSRDAVPSDSAVKGALGIGEEDSAVVLLVRLVGSTYYYDFFTYGEAYDAFSSSDVDRILDDTAVYTGIKGGNIEKGATAFFTLCAEELDAHHQKLLRRERLSPLVTVLTGVIIGLLAGGFTMLGVFLSYRRKKRGTSYPLDRYARLSLTVREDRFVGSYVTRVRVQSNNSSGGRSGGGGGHRGGR